MREKFDNVTTLNERYQRELETANARIKKLQAENNLLLDAMNIVADKCPIYSYLPENQQLEQPAPLPEPPYPANPPSEYRQYEPNTRSRRSSSHSSHMNGSNGYSNGTRHRPIEPQYDPHDDTSSTEYTPHSANGR
ncbi:hypothetical protein BDQ17DRAFT_1362717 [Cyathus striatus]|nr:hypothetical protein BDQ17DRAFT_1362717 [Cyathus striatus]